MRRLFRARARGSVPSETRTAVWKKLDGQRLGVVMITSKKRVILDQVHARSPAHLLGMRRGMQLVEIDGVELKGTKQAMQLLRAVPSGLIELRYRTLARPVKTIGSFTILKWAVSWMLMNRRKEFKRCVALVAFDVLVKATAPIIKQYLFNTALARYLGDSIDSCLIDVVTTLVMIGTISLLHVQTIYKLEVNKMDGS